MANRSWPHPVLDSDGNDYPDCAFQAALNVVQKRTEFAIKVRMDIGSESLQQEIANGNAVHVLQIHCARTSFRDAFRSQVGEFGVQIPEPALREGFSLKPYVIAAKAFELASSEFSPIFSGMKFDMSPGYILAAGPKVDFFAVKSLDELKNIKSIFQVMRQTDAGVEKVDFDFELERIGIVLPHFDFDQYGIFRKRKPYGQVFVCSLVLPALFSALQILSEDWDADDTGRRWRRALKHRLKELGIEKLEKDRVFSVAQDLLEIPYRRAFAAIREAEEAKEA